MNANNFYKVSLLGNSTVGKTNFITQYTKKQFLESNLATHGSSYENKKITMPDKTEIFLQIWDTAGQEKYRSIVKSMFQGTKGVLLLYDITLKESFDNVSNWASQITSMAGQATVVILVGNKNDLEEERVVTKEMGEKMAQELKLPFFEASAKTGNNLDNIFMTLINLMIKNKDTSVNTDCVFLEAKTITNEKKKEKKKC